MFVVNTDDDNKTEGITKSPPTLWRLSAYCTNIIDILSTSMCSQFPSFKIKQKLEYFAYLIGFLTWMDSLIFLKPILLFSSLKCKQQQAFIIDIVCTNLVIY